MAKTERKTPVPLAVEDLASFARIVASRADFIPPVLVFELGGRHVLAYMMTMPFGKLSLPLLTYYQLEMSPKPYLVYTPLERETVYLSETPETGRFVSFPIIEVDPPPKFIEGALETKRPRKISGLESVKVRNLDSLLRLVSVMIDESSNPPLWCFPQNQRYILGILYPIYEYYDSTALPVLYYVELNSKPTTPFIGYMPALGGSRIVYTHSISDARYVYGRVVYVKSFPFRL